MRVTVSFDDGKTTFNAYNPKGFVGLDDLMIKHMRVALDKLARDLLHRLRVEYEAKRTGSTSNGGALAERKRIDGRPKLHDIIARALRAVEVSSGENGLIRFDVFDLGMLRGEAGEWVDLFEDTLRDGHLPAKTTRQGASSQWAFVPLGRGMKAASDAASHAGMSPKERRDFMVYAHWIFQGKHGEGIMVNLQRPLFYGHSDNRVNERLPREFFQARTHPGVEPSNVWRTTLFGEGNSIFALRDEAIAEGYKSFLQEVKTRLQKRQ